MQQLWMLCYCGEADSRCRVLLSCLDNALLGADIRCRVAKGDGADIWRRTVFNLGHLQVARDYGVL